jgi:cellulose synthase/poly-beta-1,6-N-acetylglucosamine synthase-like glycosyltransferase
VNSGMPLPLVSIVMPSFNQGQFIEAAVMSVLEQSWQRLELIVQDGGSSDGTLEILQRLSEQDFRLTYSSSPDSGPAQALNRALAKTRGTIVGWLNSDDLYTPGALERATDYFAKHDDRVFLYGHGGYIDSEGKGLGSYPTMPSGLDADEFIPPAEQFVQGCFISQPTVFFKRVVYTLLGNLNEVLRASFDMDYWIRIFQAFEGRIGFLPIEQAKTRIYDGTITRTQRGTVAVEGAHLALKHFNVETSQWLQSYVDEQIELKVSTELLVQQLNALEQQLLNLSSPEHANKLVGFIRGRIRGGNHGL